MIGKVARLGTSFLGAIQYCYYETRANRSLDRTRIRGELLFAQHLGVTVIADDKLRSESKQRLNIEEMASTMKSVALLNERTRKPVWHQSFSFPVGESPSPHVMIRICQSFARSFGMGNNPMVAFRHRDREHDHFHIVASRIDLDGLNTAKTRFNYLEVGRFCRAMETRFNLTPGTPMTTDRKATVSATDLQSNQSNQNRTPGQPVPQVKQVTPRLAPHSKLKI